MKVPGRRRRGAPLPHAGLRVPEGALRQSQHTRAVSSLKPSERGENTTSGKNCSQAAAHSAVGIKTLLAQSRKELKKEKKAPRQ